MASFHHLSLRRDTVPTSQVRQQVGRRRPPCRELSAPVERAGGGQPRAGQARRGEGPWGHSPSTPPRCLLYSHLPLTFTGAAVLFGVSRSVTAAAMLSSVLCSHTSPVLRAHLGGRFSGQPPKAPADLSLWGPHPGSPHNHGGWHAVSSSSACPSVPC